MKFSKTLICTVLLAVLPALAHAAVPDGSAYNGHDPYDYTGVCNDARVVAYSHFINAQGKNIGKLELKWSEKCGANWALITSSQLPTGNITDNKNARNGGIVSVSVYNLNNGSHQYHYTRQLWTRTHYNPSSSPMIAGRHNRIFAKGVLKDVNTGETVYAQTAAM